MKSYTQFIKEVNTSVYGEVSIGSKPSTVSKKSVSSGVDRAIKNYGTGEGSGSTVVKKGGYGISGGVNVSMRGGSSGSSTNTKTKVRPTKTTDPKTPTGGRTSIQSSNGGRPNLVRSSSSSSSSSTQSPSRIKNPKTAAISNMRMRSM